MLPHNGQPSHFREMENRENMEKINLASIGAGKRVSSLSQGAPLANNR